MSSWNNLEQLKEIGLLIRDFPQFFILGGGSNLIVPLHYQGLVIHNQLRGVHRVQSGNDVFVTAMAGEPWDDFVAYCTTHQAYV